jgi:hypothetical protein
MMASQTKQQTTRKEKSWKKKSGRHLMRLSARQAQAGSRGR